MRSAKRILFGSPPENVAALRSRSGVDTGSSATCATPGLSLPTASRNLGSAGAVMAGEEFMVCSFCFRAAALVDAALLLLTLEPTAASIHGSHKSQ